MSAHVKFKPRQTGWYLFIGMLVVFLAAVHIIFGENYFETVFAIINGLIVPAHLVVFFRTRNAGHLVATIYYGLLSLTFFMPEHTVVRQVLGIMTALLLACFLYVLSTKTLNWRYREILELAARPINESNNGFSPRPFPAGTADYSKNDILGFARFMIRHVIAFSFIEENRVVLVIPRNMFGYLLFFKKDYRETTHVIFDFDGNMTVNISKKDYQRYVEEWTFDQLCFSLGNLFRRFLALYQNNRGNEIISMLNRFRKSDSSIDRSTGIGAVDEF